MRSPRDESRDLEGNFLESMMYVHSGLDPSEAIYAQERRGQQQLVHSDVLPTNYGLQGKREDFEALGFRFGDPVPDDPLFQEVMLPDGWRREPTEHAMWSKIVDERGLERVAVFYKAASYDRKAHMRVVNVGYEAASSFLYSDMPIPWSAFTDDERSEAIRGLEEYAAYADDPTRADVYEHIPKAKAELERIRS